MSLPVSSYEDLLRTVRGLTLEARQVQSIATPLLATLQADRGRAGGSGYGGASTSGACTAAALEDASRTPPLLLDETAPCDLELLSTNEDAIASSCGASERPITSQKIPKENGDARLRNSKPKTYRGLPMESSNANNDIKIHSSSPESYPEKGISDHGGTFCDINEESSTRGTLSNLYHGTWPVERGLWQSVPTSLPQPHQDMTSVMSFASSAGSTGPFDQALFSSNNSEGEPSIKHSSISSTQEAQQLGAKVDIVYGLLSMLGSQENADMGHTLLALSSSPESCLAMRQSGCIPLLVQLVHSECDSRTRQQATQALHNLVQAQPDDRLRRRESRVLRLLEQIRVYCETASSQIDSDDASKKPSDKDLDKHPGQIIANLMKLSFDEAHRIAICQLGGLQTIAQLIQVDHIVHGSECEDTQCVTLRRYAGMALTNLTFGDGNNKALLCSLRDFMTALVKQLYSVNEDLKQVTASVLRNLSWRADSSSKQILREVGAVTGLAQAAMSSRKESTLKSVLSALWNLSAHCSINKADICGVEGLLAFIVTMLSYKSPSKTLAIIENAGGILRNISSHIAVRDDYRAVLREHNCLQILLHQLRSPSLTVVSNACGTLWNLSAKCPVDQKALWDMGAVPMLRSLTHSKHKMISMGSSAALKNLLSARPSGGSLTRLDSTAKALGLSTLPTLGARKQRALEQELDKNLAETCENIEPSLSPSTSTNDKFSFNPSETHISRILSSQSYTQGCRQKTDICLSESRESVTSTHSDSVYERVVRTLPKRNESPSSSVKTENEYSNKNKASSLLLGTKLSQSDSIAHCAVGTSGTSDQKFVRRYENSHYEQKPLNFNIWSNKNSPTTSNFSRTPRTNTTSTYIPMRNKYSDCVPEDEQTGTDQTVDYSQKYTEVRLSDSEHTLNNNASTSKTNKPPAQNKTETSQPTSNKNKVEVAYGNYAITDLDQPTDYSLRYAEDGAESEIMPTNKQKMFGHEFSHEDTIKTYCTEGTPYETPFNFSNSTSMNDLRIENTIKINNDTHKNSEQVKSKESEVRHSDEKDKCSAEDISKMGTEDNSSNSKYPRNFKSECSSGLISPDKPVNYCEEGTPGYFSRVSSLSSLNSVNIDTPDKKNSIKMKKSLSLTPDKDASEQNIPTSGIDALKQKSQDGNKDRECKVVTFGACVDYAEETPLMFSRSSSLASLDSVEQHSIHDDRSSVISDFSRRTSGIVSPSELPDSPTQTIPPTPVRPMNNPNNRIGKNLQPNPSTSVKRSVFEDDIAPFKDENTPIEFSRATSLSSLTIDDEVKIASDALNKEIPQIRNISTDQSSIKPLDIPSTSQIIPTNERLPNSLLNKPNTCINEPAADVTRVYHTEDTPAILSHAGSFSNLSEISAIADKSVDDISPRLESSNDEKDPIKDKENPYEPNLELIDEKLERRMENLSINSTDLDTLTKPSISQQNAEIPRELDQVEIANVVSDKSSSSCPEERIHSDINDDSFNLSDIGSNTSADEQILQQCIQAGIDKTTGSSTVTQVTVPYTKPLDSSSTSSPCNKYTDDIMDLSDESGNTSADEHLLQQCIKAGMDRVTSTAHTIIALPKKSDKKLNVSKPGEMSDDSYSSSDERLLQECIKVGMARVAANSTIETTKNIGDKGKQKVSAFDDSPASNSGIPQFKYGRPTKQSSIPRFGFTKKSSVNKSSPCTIPKEPTSQHVQNSNTDLEFSDDGSINSADERLLVDCIKLGIERATKTSLSESKDEKFEFSDDSNTSADERLLQECIQLGMERVTKGSADARLIHGEDDDNASITSADERLLSECINLGIQSVTGEKPQISTSLLKQPSSQLRKPEAGSSASYSRKLDRKEKRPEGSNSNAPVELGYFKQSSKQKGISERLSRSVPLPVAANRLHNISTISLDSTASLNESEKALLDECIRAGMARATGQPMSEIRLSRSHGDKSSAIRPDNRKPIGAERDDDHTLKEQNYSTNHQHPAFRESSFTTRVPHPQRLKSSVGSRENHPESSMSRQEYYNTRVPTFAHREYNLHPKNVQAPPVAVSTASIEDVSIHNTTQVTGAESAKRYAEKESPNGNGTRIPYQSTCVKSPDGSIRPIENSWIGETRSGCDESDYVTCGEENTLIDATSQDCNDSMSDDGSIECSEELKYDYCKPRDPDSMLASVERLTAELVSHATHLHADRLMKQSTQDTWNDSSSTNDLTFPSISTSAPVIVSIKSDDIPNFIQENESNVDVKVNFEHKINVRSDQEHKVNVQTNFEQDVNDICTNLDFKIDFQINSEIPFEKDDTVEDLTNPSSLDTMTDSTVIAQEASKLASEMVQSTSSFSSVDLENIKPPSNMGSLISLTSTSGHWETTEFTHERHNSFSLRKIASKKKVPSDIMVRMALSNSSNHADSFDLNINGGNSSASSMNLDHVKPPSLFNDMSDMESSMISVCSIMSEVADAPAIKTDFIPNGLVTTDVFDTEHKTSLLSKEPMSLTAFMMNSVNQSYSDIENINPPSYFNEISDMTDVSLNDHRTDTICDMTTDVFEDCLTHVVDSTLRNDTDITDYSDANSVTPIQSDYATSSAESTPKKTNNANRRLTPKQRRQLTKERFKTYTVDTVINEEEQKRLSEVAQTEIAEENSLSPKNTKITPKQRRQENRSRFETRVLDVSALNSAINQPEVAPNPVIAKQPEIVPPENLRKTIKQRRLEDKERFRTRTLTEGSSPPSSLPIIKSTEELHDMLEQEANVVLNTLNENTDDFLDCETLSLVSNEDESERNSMNSGNFRTYHKSWGFTAKPAQVCNGFSKSGASAVTAPQVSENIQEPLENSESDRESVEAVEIKSKPKIVKPDSNDEVPEEIPPVEQVKAIRGKRKPLYVKTSVPSRIIPKSKPTSNIKPAIVKKSNEVKQNSVASKIQAINKITNSIQKPPIHAPKRVNSNISLKSNIKPPSSPKKPVTSTKPPNLPPKPFERQNTFTKDDQNNIRSPSKTRIPLPSTSTDKTTGSKIPSATNIKAKTTLLRTPTTSPNLNKKILSKSSSVELNSRKITSPKMTPLQSRAPSTQYLKNSSSNQSLKNSRTSGTSSPKYTQRSYSNSSIQSNGSTRKTPAASAQKEVTSKIASLWKKIEATRSQPKKKDTRVWISNEVGESSNEEPQRLIRSSTFESTPGELPNRQLPDASKTNRCTYNFESTDYMNSHLADITSNLEQLTSRVNAAQTITDGSATIVLRRRKQIPRITQNPIENGIVDTDEVFYQQTLVEQT